jgi:hypothetical protein
MIKLTKEEKKQVYYAVMESLQNMLLNHLNELSNYTVKNAAEKALVRQNKLLRRDPATDKYVVDKDAFKKYLEGIKNPAERKRLIKLYNNKMLADKIISQCHMLSTVANSDLEWFRENTDISLSPEFFQSSDQQFNAVGNNSKAWGTTTKFTPRKPTKDEHDFYRFFSSMGTDTEGMSEENIERYRKAWRDFYLATMGIDPMTL